MQVFPHLALFHSLVGMFTLTSDLHLLLTHAYDTTASPPSPSLLENHGESGCGYYTLRKQSCHTPEVLKTQLKTLGHIYTGGKNIHFGSN